MSDELAPPAPPLRVVDLHAGRGRRVNATIIEIAERLARQANAGELQLLTVVAIGCDGRIADAYAWTGPAPLLTAIGAIEVQKAELIQRYAEDLQGGAT